MERLKLLLSVPPVYAYKSILVAQPKPWVCTDNFKSMKNPVLVGDVSTRKAGTLYKNWLLS